MVQTTYARHSHHRRIRCWPLLDGPLVRGVFGQRVVHPVLMVVADVFTHEPAQMSFVQHDDPVQHLPATTPYPSFRGSILPGRLGARALRCQSRSWDKLLTTTSNSSYAPNNRIEIPWPPEPLCKPVLAVLEPCQPSTGGIVSREP